MSDCCDGVCCGLNELDPKAIATDCIYSDKPLTIDEAIKHAMDVAENNCNMKCAMQHKQLANWLIELKEYRRNDANYVAE